MSQKIIIPKGTIDSTQTTIIEIPNYLHETSTVVVTTPKTADMETEEAWERNEYEENNPEHNESTWEQDYEVVPEMGNETAYSPEQQVEYQYAVPAQESDLKTQVDNRPNYTEEPAAPAPKKTNYDQYQENATRRMMEKQRELAALRSQRQRLVEGEVGTYEAVPQTEDNMVNLSEVPENMRGRPSPRDIELEKERRRKQMESQRYQSRSLSRQAGYKPGHPRDQNSPTYAAEMQSQRYPANSRPVTQQYAPDIHGYPDMQYVRQGQPRPQYPQGQVRRQMPEQVMSPEDMGQYQRSRRRTMFNVPKN